MKHEINSQIHQFVFSLSQALDLINPAMANHHKRVAYIALRIAEAAGLTSQDKEDVLIAAALHDVGALSFGQMSESPGADSRRYGLSFNLRSANYGYQLLQKFKPFQRSAAILRFHSLPWSWGTNQEYHGETVPLGSHIVHLANLVDHLTDKDRPILQQVTRIFAEVMALQGQLLMPDHVEAFLEAADNDAFWLDLDAPDLIHLLFERAPFSVVEMTIDGLLDFAELLAQIIDFRCRYTATHSRGVGATTAILGKLIGFPEIDCKRLLVAGYLHDIGKLALPMDLLEKSAALNDAEWRLVRSHPYHSYRILAPIQGMEDIALWCGSHHERLGGQGYPFRMLHTEIPLEARILAVADVFTALTENRPYRSGLGEAESLAILADMVKQHGLDAKVCQVLKAHFAEVNQCREMAQEQALREYRQVMEGVAMLDLSAARATHRAWKQSLRAYLDGDIELPQQELVNHHDCGLGRWYYGEGLRHYGDIPEMRDLEAPHAELHSLIHTLLHHREQGRMAEAEACYPRVEPISTRIVELLHAIENQAALMIMSRIDDVHQETDPAA
jgi:HD-GYP domain-containing protein (c-di-GMP phosphodiesterase class II)